MIYKIKLEIDGKDVDATVSVRDLQTQEILDIYVLIHDHVVEGTEKRPSFRMCESRRTKKKERTCDKCNPQKQIRDVNARVYKRTSEYGETRSLYKRGKHVDEKEWSWWFFNNAYNDFEDSEDSEDSDNGDAQDLRANYLRRAVMHIAQKGLIRIRDVHDRESKAESPESIICKIIALLGSQFDTIELISDVSLELVRLDRWTPEGWDAAKRLLRRKKNTEKEKMSIKKGVK